MTADDDSRTYPPSPAIVEEAWVKDWRKMETEAAADPVAYWDGRAKELLWSQPWNKVLDASNAPFYRWFTGGRTNIVTNAIDRHLDGPRKNKLALLWQSEGRFSVRPHRSLMSPDSPWSAERKGSSLSSIRGPP